MNKVILIGRLTADPELKQTSGGVAVTTFTAAVERPWQRDRERTADFIPVTAWRQAAEFVCKNFCKGKPILVEGRLQSREYTARDGEKRRVWEVVADSVGFAPCAARGPSPEGGAPADAPEPAPADIDYGDLPF